VSRHAQAVRDFRWSLPAEWARDEPRRQAGHVPEHVAYRTRHEQGLERRALGGAQVPHGWGTGDEELGRHTGCRQALRERGERDVLGGPAPPSSAPWRRPCPRTQGVDDGRQRPGTR
jgi:hypothetical protein